MAMGGLFGHTPALELLCFLRRYSLDGKSFIEAKTLARPSLQGHLGNILQAGTGNADFIAVLGGRNACPDGYFLEF